MNTYKLGNIIKKYLLTRFNNSQISKKHFSFKLLNKLCNTYPIVEFIQDYYCCYGEDICCWQDENICWYGKISQKQINQKVYKTIKRYANSLKNTNKFNIYKRKVFLCETDTYIWYCIPLRDVTKEDLFIVFDKTKKL